jgi:putative heme-binding domain-containing protein
MPPTRLSDEDTWNLVAFIHAMAGPASGNTVPGNGASGATVFYGAKAGCSNCHSILGKGGRMGPDLTHIGARPLAVIRESILEPSKDLSFLGNEGIAVTLKDGRKIQGVARNRSNYALQVVDGAGTLHLISMSDVTALEISESSPMPADIAKRLTKEELTDLVAFLAKQDPRAQEKR